MLKNKKLKLQDHSLMFAPMEGITDGPYRLMISGVYPEWDTYSCDFLRVPTPSLYPIKHIRKHFGEKVLANKNLQSKTIYQILTAPNSYTAETVQAISSIGVQWLDLNLGCPSKTVCKNQGGSSLLANLPELKSILKTVRSNFPGTFSCKIRVGYRDDTQFDNILHLLEDEGVDCIKIHARTRDELYKGTANWDYVKHAVKTVKVPIVGNGDIWTTADIDRYFDYTECHSVMMGRSALKTPWLAKLYKEKLEDTVETRVHNLILYFNAFYEATLSQNLSEASRIKRLKSVSRYIFEGIPNGDIYKKNFLLSKSFAQQTEVLEKLQSEFL